MDWQGRDGTLGKSKSELRDFCVALGESAYRGGQLYHALYAGRKFSIREITNLPAAFRNASPPNHHYLADRAPHLRLARWLGALPIRLFGFRS